MITLKKSDNHLKFFQIGFHGDLFLINIIDYLIVSKKIDLFIETGANVGSTLAYFAKKYPNITCYSCEPDSQAFKRAHKNTKGLSNVHLFNYTSQEFISVVLSQKPELYERSALFWIDAHGIGFEWPLQEEIEFISLNFKRSFVFIDDFEVPHKTYFSFHRYKNHVCNFPYIINSIKNCAYQLFYPNYEEKTSKHHPLTGWALLVFGVNITPWEMHPLIKKDKMAIKPSFVSFGRMALRNRFDDINSFITTKNPVVIDAGAYHGFIVDFFLNNYSDATICAFEPNPHAFEILQRKYNDNKNIKLFCSAVGAKSTKIKFNILKNEVSSSILNPTDWNYKYHKEKMDIIKLIEVDLLRIDDVILENEIDLIKLDLQGYELEALKGSEKLLPNTKIITTEVEFVPLYENQPLFADIDLFLRKRGFRLFNLYDLYTQADGQLTAGDAIYLNERYF